MSFLSGIASVFTGNSDKAFEAAKGIGGFIDESILTPQEKAELHQKLFDAKIKWVNATQGQNLARRYCAIFFGVNYLLTFQVCMITLLVDFIRSETIAAADFVANVVELAITFRLGWIMLAIISFYFLKEHGSFTGMINRFKK